jgi:hypothetical protein
VDGKMRIVWFEPSAVFDDVETVVYADKTNFVALREHERVPVKDGFGGTKQVGIGKWWLSQPDRTQYDRVVFDPGLKDPRAFNLWRGFGLTVFQHACKMGLEGIVSKRLGSRYRSRRSPDWLKFKNPEAPAVKREAEEEWGQ